MIFENKGVDEIEYSRIDWKFVWEVSIRFLYFFINLFR